MIKQNILNLLNKKGLDELQKTSKKYLSHNNMTGALKFVNRKPRKSMRKDEIITSFLVSELI